MKKKLSPEYKAILWIVKRLEPQKNDMFGDVEVFGKLDEEETRILHKCIFPAEDWSSAKRIASLIYCNEGVDVWDKRWRQVNDQTSTRIMKNHFEPGITYQVDITIQGIRVEIRT